VKKIELAGGAGYAREPSDPPPGQNIAPALPDIQQPAIDWAVTRVSEAKSDPTVQTLIDDAQALKATVKAMASGPVTLTKAQTLTVMRALLYLLKGDKTA
jgi:hypothetical protein